VRRGNTDIENSVIREAGGWRERADSLLERSGLEALLGQHGEVHFSGSYAYDLMMTPDIDIHVVIQGLTRESAVRVLSAAAASEQWATITFADRADDRFRPETFDGSPRGYYIGLATDVGEATWRVDVWLLDAARYSGDTWGPRMAAITDEERAAILTIKAARNQGNISATAVEIYRAVLDEGLRTVEEVASKTSGS
jgi:hypothetical protein